MRLLEALSTQPLLHALGWALLHSLWQGALLAASLAGLLRLLKGRSADARYAASCAALALMLLAPAATAFRGFVAPPATGAASRDASGASGVATTPDDSAATDERAATPNGASSFAPAGGPLAESLEGVLPWLSLLWTAGVLLLSARTIGGAVYARRLAREGTREADERWREKFAVIARRLRVSRPVCLLESSIVQVPTAVGWLKPVVLLPASALTGLTARQLEVILAHELAHIRRHDYLVNLLQTFAETLLFYHPAAWWVSGRVRDEREHACDDVAVGTYGGDALAYARALTQMERLRHTTPRLATAASGGNLRARVRRLVGAPAPSRAASPLVVASLFSAALLTTVACTHAALSQRPTGNTANAGGAATAKSNSAGGAKKAAVAVNPNMPREVAALIEADNTEGEDLSARRAAIDALGNRAGSIVVMDAKTGRVYTIVNQEWALRRGWLPASTMKVVAGLAGLGEKTFDPSEKIKVSDRPERLDLTDAMALSNNPYFVSLSDRVGAQSLISYARRLGYGEATGINLEGELPGRLPEPASVKAAGPLGAHGEGVEVTPIQLATVYAAFANGGQLLTPRVPRTEEEAARFEPQVRRRLDIPRDVVERVLPGLVAAVERGSGSEAQGAGVKVAGKTGSAGGKHGSHGIFASYAPADDPRLVVVVIMRGKDENGRKAAGVAASVYKALSSRL